MKTIKILVGLFIISMIFAILFTVAEYIFGADKVFKFALYSMPVILLWRIVTTPKKKSTN